MAKKGGKQLTLQPDINPFSLAADLCSYGQRVLVNTQFVVFITSLLFVLLNYGISMTDKSTTVTNIEI